MLSHHRRRGQRLGSDTEFFGNIIYKDNQRIIKAGSCHRQEPALLYLCKYCRNAHDPVPDLRENFSVHFAHKPAADIKSQAAARYAFGIRTAPEAFKNVWQVRVRKGTAAVADGYKNTSVLLGKM